VPTAADGIIDPMSLLRDVEFSRTIECSMPALGQSWMLQRAKWKKHVTKDLEKQQQQQLDRTRMALGSLQYWAMSQPIADFCAWTGQSSHPPVVMVDESNSSHDVAVHAGVLCKSSGRVQVIARTYGDDDHAAAGASKSLKSVSFLDGFVPR
jgi:hypothetical protein